MLENNDYYNWLIYFTEEYPFFTNEMFGKNLYYDEDFEKCPISNADCYRVSQLYVLYNILDEYAVEIKNRTVVFGSLKKGYYFSCECAKYFIQTELTKGGLIYSCSRLADNHLETFIDIEDIRKIYNQRKDKEQQKLALEKFRNEIRTLVADNISADEILKVVNEEIGNSKVKKLGTK